MSDPKTGWRTTVTPEGASPIWDACDTPTCSLEGCPAYDGKRCRLTGFRPRVLCNPTVDTMIERIKTEPRRLAAAVAEERNECSRLRARLQGQLAVNGSQRAAGIEQAAVLVESMAEEFVGSQRGVLREAAGRIRRMGDGR